MGLVYFMRRADGIGPIKIGYSKLPEARLVAMQVWSPEILSIIASAPGTFLDEKRLHNQFGECRLHGEWFEPVPDLIAVISKTSVSGVLPGPRSSGQHIIIAKMYRQGATLQEIGVKFGVTRERIRQILRKNGVPSLGLRPKDTALNISRASVQMALDGSTINQIASTLGVSRTCVAGALKKNGIVALKGKHPKHDDMARMALNVANDYQNGMRIADIAEKHGLKHITYIARYLKIAGVKPSRRPVLSGFAIDLNDVTKDFNAGMPLAAMSKKYGASVRVLKSFFKKTGLDVSPMALESRRVRSVVAANKRRAQ